MCHVPLAVQWNDEGGEVGDAKEGSEIPGGCEGVEIAWPLDLVLCGESKEVLSSMVRRFAKVCRRRILKINAGKGKVMVLSGEKGLECELHVDGIR